MPVTFSFGGSGHHFPFMLGVAHALKTRFDIQWGDVHAHCISGGCCGAMSLLLYTPKQIHQLAIKAITLAHHPLQLQRNDYYSQIMKHLIPATAYKVVGTRLIIGTTSLFSPLLHHEAYSTQQQLLNKIEATCRIPMITGSWQRELDGGFSHQYALADENTVVITLKRRDRSDIAARTSSFFVEMLLPSAHRMWDLYEQGIQEVDDNYEAIAYKIDRGLQDTRSEVHFTPYR